MQELCKNFKDSKLWICVTPLKPQNKEDFTSYLTSGLHTMPTAAEQTTCALSDMCNVSNGYYFNKDDIINLELLNGVWWLFSAVQNLVFYIIHQAQWSTWYFTHDDTYNTYAISICVLLIWRKHWSDLYNVLPCKCFQL